MKIIECEEYQRLVGVIIGVMGIEKAKNKPNKSKRPSLRDLILLNREMIIKKNNLKE